MAIIFAILSVLTVQWSHSISGPRMVELKCCALILALTVSVGWLHSGRLEIHVCGFIYGRFGHYWRYQIDPTRARPHIYNFIVSSQRDMNDDCTQKYGTVSATHTKQKNIIGWDEGDLSDTSSGDLAKPQLLWMTWRPDDLLLTAMTSCRRHWCGLDHSFVQPLIHWPVRKTSIICRRYFPSRISRMAETIGKTPVIRHRFLILTLNLNHPIDV